MAVEEEQGRAPPAGWGRAACAAFLTLIQPAVGMLYLGLPRLALPAWLFNAAILPALWIVPEALLPIALIFALTTGCGVALAIFAGVWARRHPAPPRRPWRRWYGLLAAYVVATALSPMAWLGLPVHNYSIPSRSMLPTLRVGEYVLAASLGRPSSPAVEPGDVVMFPLPRDPSTDYVKRVVAMGGDTVQMRRGILHINGAPVRREPAPDIPVPADAGDAASPAAQVWRETLPDGRSYLTLKLTETGLFDDTEEVRVPAGQVFVLGDNRDNSLDSRDAEGFGTLRSESLRFRAVGVVWGPDRARIGIPLNR